MDFNQEEFDIMDEEINDHKVNDQDYCIDTMPFGIDHSLPPQRIC